ncbi:PLP-dependent transferase, partial [Tilletiaria anomala UBC 951]
MTSSLPKYSLNPHLLHDTIEPPVALARAWASSFPLPASPCPTVALINLAQGVPGTDPPPTFTDKLKSAKIQHDYGDVFGSPKLRQAFARDLNTVYRGDLTASQRAERGAVKMEDVCITSGANMAFAAVVQALAAKGDTIVLPTPWYFNHYMTLTSLGIEAQPLHTAAPGFVVTPAMFRTAIDACKARNGSAPKALVLVTPNNPTGTIYSPSRLTELAQLCRQHRIALILDETYRDFLLDEARSARSRPHQLFGNEPAADPRTPWDWRDTLIHISSFSKSYAIPGHRLGAIACHPALLARVGGTLAAPSETDAQQQRQPKGKYGPIAKALDNLQICPPLLSTQVAVAWSVEDSGQQQWRVETAAELYTRRTLFKEAVEGLSVQSGGAWQIESMGAYYAFVKHPWTGKLDSESVARALAGLVGVITLPGSFFMPPSTGGGSTGGAEERLRFSIANVSADRLRNLPERLHLLDALWHDRGIGFGIEMK